MSFKIFVKIELNIMSKVVVGIDIGGTYTKLGLVSQKGRIIQHCKISTACRIEIKDYIDDLNQAIKTMSMRAGQPEIVGIGLGAPNANAYKGTIEEAPNLKWKGTIPLVKLLKKHHQVLIILINDANAAALGEMYYGGAKNMKDFMMITLGTGLGGAIISNGQLVQGYSSFAGEIGHILVKPNGRQCGCGRKGCLETYISATGIKRTVYKFLADSIEESVLRAISFDELTPKMIYEAAEDEDKIALKAFKYTGRILGLKLADTMVYTSPEAIFLFGGLANAGQYLLKPTRASFQKNLLPVLRGRIVIKISQLQKQNPAILGSAGLIWDKLNISSNLESMAI